MADPVLQLSKVSKSYKGKAVLRGLDLAIPAGSVVGLLGRNGAGKSTLLRCALGLARPDAGEVTVWGEPAADLPAGTRARIGYAPQAPALFEWMTVAQTLAYTAAFYPRWDHALVERLRREWGLEASARVGKMSPGEVQKLSILVAMGPQPDLLVLDEPAASLDPTARRQFLQALLERVGGDRTVLFSTHITQDLERVADRVAVLKDGHITWMGGLDELKEEVVRLHVRGRAQLPARWDLPGLLRLEVSGLEAVASVRGVDPARLRALEAQWDASIEVRALSLEDIFMELHAEGRPRP